MASLSGISFPLLSFVKRLFELNATLAQPVYNRLFIACVLLEKNMATESEADSSCSTNGLSTSGGSSSSKKARRQVTRATFEKWQCEFKKEYQSMSWLHCEVEKTDKNIVSKLFCLVCQKYEDRIQSVKYFSAAWITRSANHNTSNIIDHTKSEQHKQAMSRLRIDQARASNESITSYSTIACCLSVIDEQTRLKLIGNLSFVM